MRIRSNDRIEVAVAYAEHLGRDPQGLPAPSSKPQSEAIASRLVVDPTAMAKWRPVGGARREHTVASYEGH